MEIPPGTEFILNLLLISIVPGRVLHLPGVRINEAAAGTVVDGKSVHHVSVGCQHTIKLVILLVRENIDGLK